MFLSYFAILIIIRFRISFFGRKHITLSDFDNVSQSYDNDTDHTDINTNNIDKDTNDSIVTNSIKRKGKNNTSNNEMNDMTINNK